MKSFALAAVLAPLFLIGATVANASDAATSTWTGFYMGLNAGYAWQDRSVDLIANDPATSFHFPALPGMNGDIADGFAGFQIGYNWQIDQRWVTGLEADFQFGSLKSRGASTVVAPFIGPTSGIATFAENINWFGTVRARLGFLLTRDILLYGTGGLAYGEVERNAVHTVSGIGALDFASGFSFNCPLGGVACFTGTSSRVQFGWSAGGGAEWTIWKDVRFKAEYLYINLGDESLQVTALNVLNPGNKPASFTAKFGDADFQIVRAGLNVRF